MIDLEEVAVALDSFPDWDENMRADVYHAIDVAPENPLTSFRDAEAYFENSAGVLAWNRIKAFRLEHNSDKRWAGTLDEAAGYESAPTGDEILRSLQRGARMIR